MPRAHERSTSWNSSLAIPSAVDRQRAAGGAGVVVLRARHVRSSARTSRGWSSSASAAPLPPGGSSRSTARPATRRGCCRRAGTSGCGAGSTRSCKVPLVDGAARSRSRWSSPHDGAPHPAERMLGREVACDNFQDARGVPRRRRREAAGSSAFLTAGHVPHQPGAVRRRDGGERRAVRHDARAAATSSSVPAGSRSASSPRSTAARFRPGDLAGPAVHGHDSFQRGQAFIDAGGCRGLQEEVLLVGLVEPEPVVRRRSSWCRMTEIPIGYVGVVVSYVGGEHVDVSGDDVHARRPRRARPQGRVGRAAAARQAPAQHARDEGRARADDQHRPQLGAAHRGAPVRRASCRSITVRSQGRLLVQPRRLADHPHRHEECAARDLARRARCRTWSTTCCSRPSATTSATRRRR